MQIIFFKIVYIKGYDAIHGFIQINLLAREGVDFISICSLYTFVQELVRNIFLIGNNQPMKNNKKQEVY